MPPLPKKINKERKKKKIKQKISIRVKVMSLICFSVVSSCNLDDVTVKWVIYSSCICDHHLCLFPIYIRYFIHYCIIPLKKKKREKKVLGIQLENHAFFSCFAWRYKKYAEYKIQKIC